MFLHFALIRMKDTSEKTESEGICFGVWRWSVLQEYRSGWPGMHGLRAELWILNHDNDILVDIVRYI
jgi:hypothetical protein